MYSKRTILRNEYAQSYIFYFTLCASSFLISWSLHYCNRNRKHLSPQTISKIVPSFTRVPLSKKKTTIICRVISSTPKNEVQIEKENCTCHIIIVNYVDPFVPVFISQFPSLQRTTRAMNRIENK